MGYQRIYNGELSPKEGELFFALAGNLLPDYLQLELPLIITDDKDFPKGQEDSLFDIDLLGCYQLEYHRIVLYVNRIKKTAHKMGCDVDALQAIVFSHEMGHYIFFAHPLSKDMKPFHADLHVEYDSELYEIYAQIFACWAVEDSKSVWASSTFEEFVSSQPKRYQSFMKYANYNREKLINLIADFRAGKHTKSSEWKTELDTCK